MIVKHYIGHKCIQCLFFEYWRVETSCSRDDRKQNGNDNACIYFEKKSKGNHRRDKSSW